MKDRHFTIAFYLLFTIVALFIFTACDDNVKEKTLTPDRDAAETLAGALAYNTGGMVDQISDLCELLVADTSSVEKHFSSKYPSRLYIMNKVYNEITGEWTITLERSRGDDTETPFSHIHRIYTLKYLDIDGNPQKFYVTENDTARTVNFRIKHGSGTFRTRRINQQLDSLSGYWVVSNAHSQTISISGNYYRAAQDTITGWNRIRHCNHVMSMNFTDMTAKRLVYTNFYRNVSGPLVGSFYATVTFTSGSPYNETTIQRMLNINLGNGRGNIVFGNNRFTADLYLGELID